VNNAAVDDALKARDGRHATLSGLSALPDLGAAGSGSTPPPTPPPAVVLFLHGGQVKSRKPVRRINLAALRMTYFARALRTDRPLPQLMLRYRYRGWNATDDDALPDPVADALEALASIERRLGSVPVILVGHSMGGRTAVRAAAYPTVRAVAAVAPWLPEDEPVEPLRGRSLLIVHGRSDRVTSVELSAAFARRCTEVTAETELQLLDDGHAMLRAAADWHRIVGEFVSRVAR
jgi:pimeloyl-ACP methyl ester carboxylesterase